MDHIQTKKAVNVICENNRKIGSVKSRQSEIETEIKIEIAWLQSVIT